jgi:hypothetical protein
VYRFSSVSLSFREQWPDWRPCRASASGRSPAANEHIELTSPLRRLTKAEESVERGGRDWPHELLEELTLLSAAWTGIPLFPRSSGFDEHERKEQ